MLNNKKTGAEEEAGMSMRQRLRQRRELEEKRKFGLAPLAVDALTGSEISPNVPQLISQAPWYYGATGPTLDHQRQKHTDAMDTLQDQHDTVVVLGKATTYAAGACGNCGATTHKTNECYKPRRKVGAMYGGKVTGVDVHVERAEKSYAQKRDRYATGAGVDLLQQASQEAEEETGADGVGDNNSSGAKRPRLQDVFTAQTAVTSGSGGGGGAGVEIKELPKHLQNLDNDGVLFDPKTGSMRGNPNEADLTRTFQGDLQRYRSGDYYTYLEMQLRFLKGESASIVDFRLDEQLQKQRKQQQRQVDKGGSSGDGGDPEATVRERLVRSLYGESTLASAESSLRMKEALAAAASAAPPLSAVLRPPHAGTATRNGHACVYGSYFDRDEFRWGYKCCKRLGKDAAACQSATQALETATAESTSQASTRDDVAHAS